MSGVEELTDSQIADKKLVTAYLAVTTYSTLHLNNSVILARHDDTKKYLLSGYNLTKSTS